MRKFDHQSGKRFGDLYFEEIGEGEPWVLLHGGFGSLEDFNGLLEVFQGARMIALDSRGQGASGLGDGPLTYSRLQQDLEDLLSHLGLERVSLVGFSDGGIVAQRMAAGSPSRVQKLVSIGARWKAEEDPETIKLLAGVTGESWRKKFPETYDLYQRVNPEPEFDELARRLVPMWLGDDYPGEQIRKISCPTLLIRGDDDHLVPLQSMLEAKERIQGAHFLNVAFAGHQAFPNPAVVAALEQFYSKI